MVMVNNKLMRKLKAMTCLQFRVHYRPNQQIQETRMISLIPADSSVQKDGEVTRSEVLCSHALHVEDLTDLHTAADYQFHS